MISIPVFDKRIIWFTIQIETDAPEPNARAVGMKMRKAFSKVNRQTSKILPMKMVKRNT
jgi:hypothetical protein